METSLQHDKELYETGKKPALRQAPSHLALNAGHQITTRAQQCTKHKQVSYEQRTEQQDSFQGRAWCCAVYKQNTMGMCQPKPN